MFGCRESSHQRSGEVKSQTDGAFPGDSATWLMALLRACPGIACRYNSPLFCHLPVPFWSQFMNWDGVYLSREVTVCLRITLSPSPLLHIPSGPLSSRSTELLFLVTGSAAQCITVSQLALYCKGFISRYSAALGQWIQPKHHFTIYVLLLMQTVNKISRKFHIGYSLQVYHVILHLSFICL